MIDTWQNRNDGAIEAAAAAAAATAAGDQPDTSNLIFCCSRQLYTAGFIATPRSTDLAMDHKKCGRFNASIYAAVKTTTWYLYIKKCVPLAVVF